MEKVKPTFNTLKEQHTHSPNILRIVAERLIDFELHRIQKALEDKKLSYVQTGKPLGGGLPYICRIYHFDKDSPSRIKLAYSGERVLVEHVISVLNISKRYVR